MKFSIIVPVYNAAAFLEATVQSVFDQTCSDWELLLIDDGSTDGETGALCDRIAAKDNRITSFHKSNGGAGDARNYGIPRASGDYLFFLDSDDELCSYLERILQRDAFDHTGLIYGLGHAVYTVTDPRAEIVKRYAAKLAADKGQDAKLELIKSVERLGPQVMRDVRGITKPISTNIDMYTGFVYEMLGIPQDLFTPIFAIARMAGWAAHRMEELYGPARIIRPAYNSVMRPHSYVPIDERK
jgi:glycosyltransferase involved in cell wall biosynthesis